MPDDRLLCLGRERVDELRADLVGADHDEPRTAEPAKRLLELVRDDTVVLVVEVLEMALEP